jgi:MFS transporter, OFA family, oxalate/formate antiporter
MLFEKAVSNYISEEILMAKTKKYPNRWTIAFLGVVMQICLGTVYGYSVYTKPLEKMYGWNRTEVTLIFSIAIGCLGIASALGGMIVDKKGPRFVATLGGLMFGIGTFLTGFGVFEKSLGIIYLSYGVIAGLGIGLSYITPISVLVKWFPDKRGFITGLAVMGFGFGAFFMTTFTPDLIQTMGISQTFYLLGIIFLVLLVVAGRFMINPPKDYRVACLGDGNNRKPSNTQVDAEGEKPFEVAKTRDFWLFWAILFLNISAGIALISQASPMVQEIYMQTPAQAGMIVGVFSIFNGLGRLFWSWASDTIGRRNVFVLFFVSQAIVFLILPYVTSITFFVFLASYIYACYGAGFSTMPAFVADRFGSKFIGTIYGWLLTAWSAAAIVGPILYSTIKQANHNYSTAMIITGISLLFAAVLPILVGKPSRSF